ncbi:VOC family protein [Sporolactobacillus shoreicorticis]|uniref:VOC family protein n=1 Tax=Sporolactobacillus shoreicorticis TaxID=1923877 RepID=A0ABW5S053_9BACL|nr:VOC family protein [Sporolactobacillus shoreicorticis]MCO7124727.1 VOC family protein [Sporolactobacillus shoreicorticis]
MKTSRNMPGMVHHLAFRSDSKHEVDRVFAGVERLSGATVVDRPQYWTKYCPDYYAFFFNDSEGNRIEVVNYSRG